MNDTNCQAIFDGIVCGLPEDGQVRMSPDGTYYPHKLCMASNEPGCCNTLTCHDYSPRKVTNATFDLQAFRDRVKRWPKPWRFETMYDRKYFDTEAEASHAFHSQMDHGRVEHEPVYDVDLLADKIEELEARLARCQCQSSQ